MNYNLRPVLLSLLLIIFFALAAVSPEPGFTAEELTNESAPAQSSAQQLPTEAAYVQLSGLGFFEKLFGLGNQSGSPSDDPGRNPNRTSAARAPQARAPLYPVLQPNESLSRGIHPGTSAKRGAALRLAEQGRQYMLQKKHDKAVVFLEKALALEASPYVYYYLSRAHYDLGHYSASWHFLDVASSALTARPEWLTEVEALRTRYPQSLPADQRRPLTRASAIRNTGFRAAHGM